ncbi:MAG: cyclodeaminase/cyclohydrolase family protein [Ignavibacteriales bacterium]|nr:cyclodeaminase/cyclohydrolase family protein [Ignavibacteriales bacterium]
MLSILMDARRLPNKSPGEKLLRKEAMQSGLKQAVQVPLNTAQKSLEAIKLALIVAELGNPNSITDVGVGAQMAYSGLVGGIYNVLINLKDIEDKDFVNKMNSACSLLKSEAENIYLRLRR